MTKLLPPWGLAIFGAIGLLTLVLLLALGESVWGDWCTGPRYLCKDSDHAFSWAR